ncbi:MAG: hypothetical protein KA746_15975 [Pyrinomonadaceae bacterium]|nr:hypothetical protein [Pyrinomonadaceae bacterium]
MKSYLVYSKVVRLTQIIVLTVTTLTFYSSAFSNQISFSRVAPMPNGCAVVYGNLGLGSSDFLLKQCTSSWKVIKTFDIGHISQLQFVSNDTAWGISGTKLIKLKLRKNNATFEIIQPKVIEIGLDDLYFANANVGWACGRNGTILKTTDAGRSWRLTETNIGHDLSEIRFNRRGFGWSTWKPKVSQSGNSGFIISEDWGRTWKEGTSASLPRFSTAFFSSIFHGCAIVSRTELSCTFDGKKWRDIELNAENRAALYLMNSRIGWSVGSSIIQTMDGGKTWTYSLQHPNETTRAYQGLFLSGVIFTTKNDGWAWGLTSVFRTYDQGRSWSKVSEKWLGEMSKL